MTQAVMSKDQMSPEMYFLLLIGGAVLLFFKVLQVFRQRDADAVRAKSVHPDLNKWHDGYVGDSFVLFEPIIDGKGKLTIDETEWEVRGPDAPAGARVKVTGKDGSRLRVVAA